MGPKFKDWYPCKRKERKIGDTETERGSPREDAGSHWGDMATR